MADEERNSRIKKMREERRSIRHILLSHLMWSKTKKLNGKLVSFGYSRGLIQVVQRLLNMANEEDAFWIFNGLVRSLPRLYSTEESSLEGGRLSVMRNEMTIFKAIMKENLPIVSDKLKQLGLPIETLIYEQVTSLYSNFFSSDIVLRLWDLIIFNLTCKDKEERKRAIWYILSPSYLIFKEKRSQIIAALTP